jgi:hypothetical protein
MKKTEWGEVNRGALAGLMVGSIGGMFALRLPGAMYYHDLVYLVNTPKLTLICFLLCSAGGWLLGGQIGPFFLNRYHKPQAEYVGGAVSGLLLVTAFLLVGWHFVTTQ